MPISLGEWRVRIGRFVRRKPVQVDIEKIIETVLERRKQILQKVDDLLENTKKNAAKQEAESKRAQSPSCPESCSDNQSNSPSTVSSAAEVLGNTIQDRVEPDKSNIPNLISSPTHDLSPTMSSHEEHTETAISSFSFTLHGSPGHGPECTGLIMNPLDETQLHNHSLLPDRVRISCWMNSYFHLHKYNNILP